MPIWWANASLLHLTQDAILQFFRTKPDHLTPAGIICFSMKTGIPEGTDADGRYFTPITEPLLSAIMRTATGFRIFERWTSPDRLDRPDLTWQTIILGRCP